MARSIDAFVRFAYPVMLFLLSVFPGPHSMQRSMARLAPPAVRGERLGIEAWDRLGIEAWGCNALRCEVLIRA